MLSSKQYYAQYSKTKNGLATIMYSNQKTRSKARNHNPPSYSKEEFMDWLFSQCNFNQLYNDWKDSNYNKNLKPSCDRLNDYLPYSFQNIRLTTWGDNNSKGHLDRKNGINNKRNRKVIQLSRDGTIINTYHSTREASRVTGFNQSHISAACRKNT